MKKSSFIILTFLASLSLDACRAQEITSIKPDTVIVDESDTVRYYQPRQTYNYYYRSRLWDNLFRVFFTRRYYTTINRPGYMPRHLRSDGIRTHVAHHHSGAHSPKRGGFGHYGSHHSVVG